MRLRRIGGKGAAPLSFLVMIHWAAGPVRLDQADLVLWFDPENGSPQWYASLPRDDGSIANLATALALTDGGPEPPLGTVTVDRLGPPPSPLIARTSDAS